MTEAPWTKLSDQAFAVLYVVAFLVDVMTFVETMYRRWRKGWALR